jgi:hypothetical protein
MYLKDDYLTSESPHARSEVPGSSGAGDGDGPGEDNTYEDVTDNFEDLEASEGKQAAALPVTANTKTNCATALAAKKEALKRKFDKQYNNPDDTGMKMDFYEEKKDEIARQLQLNRQGFEGVDTESRALVEGYRPGVYVHIELANCCASSAPEPEVWEESRCFFLCSCSRDIRERGSVLRLTGERSRCAVSGECGSLLSVPDCASEGRQLRPRMTCGLCLCSVRRATNCIRDGETYVGGFAMRSLSNSSPSQSSIPMPLAPYALYGCPLL